MLLLWPLSDCVLLSLLLLQLLWLLSERELLSLLLLQMLRLHDHLLLLLEEELL